MLMSLAMCLTNEGPCIIMHRWLGHTDAACILEVTVCQLGLAMLIFDLGYRSGSKSHLLPPG